jgi:hypothetical protein
MANRARIGLCGLLLLALASCTSEPAKKEAVQGRVYFHNEPLRGGTIVFTPDAARGNEGPIATGEIQSDGRFTLSTGSESGAVAGWHRVTIAASADCKPPLPPRYRDPKLSEQSREVKVGQPNSFDFRLE